MTHAFFNRDFYKQHNLSWACEKQVKRKKGKEKDIHSLGRCSNGEDTGRNLLCLTTEDLHLVLKLLCFLSVADFRECNLPIWPIWPEPRWAGNFPTLSSVGKVEEFKVIPILFFSTGMISNIFSFSAHLYPTLRLILCVRLFLLRHKIKPIYFSSLFFQH